MITHDVKQGGMEWLILRSGIVTASEMGNLLTPKFSIRTGKGVESYLAEKVAEKWQGGPLPSFRGFDMEQGHFLESEAVPWFEFAHNAEVKRVGFITTDDGRVGCSPDGLLTDCGLEIKSPHADTQVGYLLAGKLPEEYAVQVHASMFVTGMKRWKFLSYRRHFPALLLTVERDDSIQAAIGEAVDNFMVMFDAAMARMTEINGGPPRSIPKPSTTPEPAPEPKPERTLRSETPT